MLCRCHSCGLGFQMNTQYQMMKYVCLCTFLHFLALKNQQKSMWNISRHLGERLLLLSFPNLSVCSCLACENFRMSIYPNDKSWFESLHIYEHKRFPWFVECCLACPKVLPCMLPVSQSLLIMTPVTLVYQCQY